MFSITRRTNQDSEIIQDGGLGENGSMRKMAGKGKLIKFLSFVNWFDINCPTAVPLNWPGSILSLDIILNKIRSDPNLD